VEPKILFEKLIRTMAAVMPISEAAAFEIRGAVGEQLELVFHVRPGGGSEQEIAGALKAFGEIVKGAVSRKQDLAALVRQPQGKEDAPLFCLVHLMRFDTVPRFAVSVVTRCKTPQEAGAKAGILGRLTAVWQDQLPVEKSTGENSSAEKPVAEEPSAEALPTETSSVENSADC
jgi:hypothetical protein